METEPTLSQGSHASAPRNLNADAECVFEKPGALAQTPNSGALAITTRTNKDILVRSPTTRGIPETMLFVGSLCLCGLLGFPKLIETTEILARPARSEAAPACPPSSQDGLSQRGSGNCSCRDSSNNSRLASISLSLSLSVSILLESMCIYRYVYICNAACIIYHIYIYISNVMYRIATI